MLPVSGRSQRFPTSDTRSFPWLASSGSPFRQSVACYYLTTPGSPWFASRRCLCFCQQLDHRPSKKWTVRNSISGLFIPRFLIQSGASWRRDWKQAAMLFAHVSSQGSSRTRRTSINHRSKMASGLSLTKFLLRPGHTPMAPRARCTPFSRLPINPAGRRYRRWNCQRQRLAYRPCDRCWDQTPGGAYASKCLGRGAFSSYPTRTT